MKEIWTKNEGFYNGLASPRKNSRLTLSVSIVRAKVRKRPWLNAAYHQQSVHCHYEPKSSPFVP
ncbi:hypothetical protein J1TS1_37750 [Shouchella clausii]|nr:hypothetical protein J1TS1_37750 [Shouchella clausii]